VCSVNYFRREQGDFLICTDPECLDKKAVFGFLEEAQWWTELTGESLDRALRNSLCFSVLEKNRQIGIVRDRRRQGLGSWLVRCILEHPDLKDLKRVALITHDAQKFYLGLDFHFASHPSHYMERHQ